MRGLCDVEKGLVSISNANFSVVLPLQSSAERKCELHPLIHTRLGFALAQDDRSRRRAQGTGHRERSQTSEVGGRRSENRIG